MYVFKKIVFILFLVTNFLNATTTFVYDGQENTTNHKKLYGIEVLKLALNKTTPKYGEYTLLYGAKMNAKRVILTIRSNTIKNYISKISVKNELLNEFAYANFPIDRGVIGYRVSFISPDLKNNTKKYDSLKKIKNLEIGQGRGWLDSEILKYNGFKVKDISTKVGLINMIALGRIDLFPRAINEVYSEFKHFNNIKNLDYDKSFMFYYPLPKFFFSNKSNQKAMTRIEEGLLLAYKDGSLNKVFNKYYKKNIDFLNLKKRTLYKLTNPFLQDIDKSYEQYIYNPLINNKKNK